MARHKNYLFSVIGILLVAAIAGAMIMNGNMVFTADNIVTISAADSAGVAVTINSWKGAGTELSLTPNANAAVLTLTFDKKYKDLIGSANALDIDLRGVQAAAGTTADTAKVFLSDGTNTVVLDLLDADGKATIMLDKDKLEILDGFATITLQIKWYDSGSGNLTNYMAANAESVIDIAFKVLIDTSSIGAFFASTGMAVMAGVRRLSAGIGGVAGSAAAAFFTNSAVVTIAVGLMVLIGALYLTGGTKRIKRYF